MKKKGVKTKLRVTFYSIMLIITSILFLTTMFSTISKYIKINKLQDPEYMARYAREKYLYSKKDEIIIKIEE